MDETISLNYPADAGIVSMLPAPGWEMLFLDETGDESSARLVAWALTEHGTVRGLIVAATGEVVYADAVENFRGYNDRGEGADVATALEELNTTIANLARQPAQGLFPSPAGSSPAAPTPSEPSDSSAPEPFGSLG